METFTNETVDTAVFRGFMKDWLDTAICLPQLCYTSVFRRLALPDMIKARVMKMLSSRQKNILAKLLESNQFVTIEFLAKWQDVSARTVRYDLDTIDEALQQVGALITRMPGKGVMLRPGEDNRSLLYELAERTKSASDKDSQLLMMGLYVALKGSFTIQELADEFFLSRSSIQKYMPEVEEWLVDFELQVVKQAWKGLQIIGTERSVRFAVYQMLGEKQTDLDRVHKWLMVEPSDKELVQDWLTSCQEERGIHYSENSLTVLFLFLSWWRVQLESEHHVFVPKENRHKSRFRLGVVEAFIEEKVKNSRAVLHECAFLDNLFDQAKVVSYNKEAASIRHYEREITFCKQLLSQVSTILETDLQEDEKLLHDLTHHVKAAFMRMAQGVEIDNPYTEEIKVRYRAIYEMVFQMTYDMGYRLIAAETAYITMHISAAFERSRNRSFLPTVIVVCSSGLAASSILTTKLEQIEPGFHLISIVNTGDLERVLEESEPDFVLTTQELPHTNLPTTKRFRVSPILSDDDKRLIQHEAHKIINRKQLARFNELYEQATLIEPTLFDEKVHQASTQDWREAITLAAAPLLNAGYVGQSYVQEMIMSVERNGTYMVFLPRMAFVHAGPENVKKEGISMTVLEQEIDFGDLNPERVDIVIVLAMQEAHNQDFLQLFHYLENELSREKLLAKWSGRKDATK